jgi:signal transduction histidine kinase
MRTRNWSIRSKIVALAAVPLTALLVLWIFATAVTAGPALRLLSAQTLVDRVGLPGERLVEQLQVERRLSVAYLSDPRADAAALTAQRSSTDRAAADFRRSANGADAQKAADENLQAHIRQVASDLDGLGANRLHIDRREVDPIGAQNLYSAMVDTGFQMFIATAAFGDERIDRRIRAVATIARGQEHLSRSNSLVNGALLSGELSAVARVDLLQAISTGRFLLAEGVNDLSPQDRTAYQRLSTGAAFTRLRELQDELVIRSRPDAPVPVTAEQWRPTFDTATQQLTAFELNAVAALPGEARPVAVDVLIPLALAGLLGLVALILSTVVSVRLGRSMVGRLTRLRGEALEMAGERLPTVVRRLQRGEAVDVEVETPPLEYGRDEIGQVGQAFNEVQRTAVQSAVEEANVRRGINEVFLNIARRSQTLLHRQLALLDKMERRETEPDELEDLYRVDHLATRMRRHAEDLVILAGAAPGRGWRNPVPVIDVVRGAISEVEDYKRVDIVSVESAAVLGRAVGDVIHLLAELLENAASFSPPQTRVQVVGQVLPNGYALEIEDRGLGMSPEALAEANRKLLEPPDFDPTDSARLGLFVVAQLAGRHGIRVSLRPSGYGGVTAIVLVPADLVTGDSGTGGPRMAALPAGATPPNQSWDRPLVGKGTEDPARSSLAALQWQGTEELRSIPVHGRPVTINGSATPGPELLEPGEDVAGRTRPLRLNGIDQAQRPEAEQPGAVGGGPAPSAIVGGLTEDGLVQRRRTKPRRGAGEPAAPPALLPPNLTTPAGLTAPGSLASDLPSAGNGRTTSSTGLTGAGLDRSEAVTGELPTGAGLAGSSSGGMRHGVAPQAIISPVEADEPVTLDDEASGDEPLLPRRVRQASLAPQLRGPVAEQVAAPARSPEQVRSLMSALQQGTARGRREAAGLSAPVDDEPESDKQQTVEEPMWSQAATVIFPAVQDPVAAGSDDSTDDAPENHENQDA